MKKFILLVALLLVGCAESPISNDDIINIGLEEIGLEEVYIFDKDIEPDILEQNEKLLGYVTGHSGVYTMRIKPGATEDERINIITHELIHVMQYESRELLVSGTAVIYRGIPYDIKFIDYNRRPWETNTFQQAFFLEKLIRNKLNKK